MAPSPTTCTYCSTVNPPQATYCLSCGQKLNAPNKTPKTATGRLNANTILNQRYSIIKLLGSGGFGAVYKAAQKKFNNRPVAIKEMSQSNLNAQELKEAIEAFEDEAQLLANLMHPNLPRIYDHFEDSGRWYLVMDFIEGETLEDYLDRQGTIPPDEVIQIGIQLCEVLNYLHTRSTPIIFRDLKPENIMKTLDGHIYLIDFGIARHFTGTKDKDNFGTPGYAPPEQYQGQTTPRSDIYSLGATLHQLLSGTDPKNKPPFQFAPLHLNTDPKYVALEALISQMLEMDEDKRPSSASFIKKELQRIGALLKPNVIPAPQPNAVPNPVVPTPHRPPQPPKPIPSGMQICTFCCVQNPVGTAFCANCGMSMLSTPAPALNLVIPPKPAVHNPPAPQPIQPKPQQKQQVIQIPPQPAPPQPKPVIPQKPPIKKQAPIIHPNLVQPQPKQQQAIQISPGRHLRGKTIAWFSSIIAVLLVFAAVVYATSVRATFQSNTTHSTNTPPLSIPTQSGTSTPIHPGILYQEDGSDGWKGWTLGTDWKVVDKTSLWNNGGATSDQAGPSAIPSLTLPQGIKNVAIEATITLPLEQGSAHFSITTCGSTTASGWQGYEAAITYGGSDPNQAQIFLGQNELGRADFDPGSATHTYRLEIRGSTIIFLIDRVNVVEVDNYTPTCGSQVGLVSSGAIIYVSSFKIIAL